MEIPVGKPLPALTTITVMEHNRELAWRMMWLVIPNHLAHSIRSCCCVVVPTLIAGEWSLNHTYHVITITEWA